MFDKQLIRLAWEHFDEKSTANKGVKGSIPILFFGNYERYVASKIKVITVGLNPSKVEFSKQRFDTGPNIRYDNDAFINTLSNYFSNNPYCRWFNNFEKILQHLGCTYYDKDYPKTCSPVPQWWQRKSNIVLHTDVCSPIATDPTWSKLSKSTKENLLSDGNPLWKKLVSYLNPDIILISVGKAQRSKVFAEECWNELGPHFSYGDKGNTHQIKYTKLDKSMVYLLQAGNNPVSMKDEQLPEMAKHILEHYSN